MSKRQFKAESKQLLDLMINSIYTHREIFLREIVSNSSDAIDKLHYLSMTKPDEVKVAREDLRIKEASVFDDYAGNPAVFLNWDYSKRSDFIGYNIYRDGEKINGRPVSGSCLSDSPLEKGRTYHYSIETVYAHGTEAGNDVSVTV